MFITNNVLTDIAGKMPAGKEEQYKLDKLLSKLQENAPEAGLDIGHDKAVVIGIHLLAYFRRLDQGERLPEIPAELLSEISTQFEQLSRKLLESVRQPEAGELDLAEIFYLAVHFEAVKANMEEEL